MRVRARSLLESLFLLIEAIKYFNKIFSRLNYNLKSLKKDKSDRPQNALDHRPGLEVTTANRTGHVLSNWTIRLSNSSADLSYQVSNCSPQMGSNYRLNNSNEKSLTRVRLDGCLTCFKRLKRDRS